MQEGLTNAAKHAKAHRVRTTLSFSEVTIRLTVADDGEGADNEGAPDGGFGLRALKERVEALGGTVAWGDRTEGGFALVVELPIRSSQAVRPLRRGR